MSIVYYLLNSTVPKTINITMSIKYDKRAAYIVAL